jgi:hypothetical protein
MLANFRRISSLLDENLLIFWPSLLFLDHKNQLSTNPNLYLQNIGYIL